jgi:hypothetical protein
MAASNDNVDDDMIESLLLKLDGSVDLTAKHIRSHFGDLKWVRGTNTSVFLSCYHEAGRWKLMAKGEQMKRGFVPMMETIDGGIAQIFASNFREISGYPPRKIKDSGAYAKKEYNIRPFDVSAAFNTITDLHAAKKGKTPCGIVRIIFAVMRLKQYLGASNVTGVDFRTSECYQADVKTYESARRELRDILDFIESDASRFRRLLPSRDGLSIETYESYKRAYLSVQNKYLQKYGFESSDYANATMLLNPLAAWTNQNIARQMLIEVVATGRRALLRTIIAAKLLLDAEVTTPAFHALAEQVTRALEKIDIDLGLLEEALDKSAKPRFALGEHDREILAAPIPIVVASTVRGADLIKGNQEENIIGTVDIGADSIDVIFVQERHAMALRQLLLRLTPPIEDVEIRVDDTVFGG